MKKKVELIIFSIVILGVLFGAGFLSLALTSCSGFDLEKDTQVEYRSDTKELKSLQDDIAKAEAEKKSRDTLISQLRNRYTVALEKFDAASKSGIATREELESARVGLQDLLSEIQAQQKENDELEIAIRTARELLDQREDALAEAESVNADLVDDNKKLDLENESNKGEISELDRTYLAILKTALIDKYKNLFVSIEKQNLNYSPTKEILAERIKFFIVAYGISRKDVRAYTDVKSSVATKAFALWRSEGKLEFFERAVKYDASLVVKYIDDFVIYINQLSDAVADVVSLGSPVVQDAMQNDKPKSLSADVGENGIATDDADRLAKEFAFVAKRALKDDSFVDKMKRAKNLVKLGKYEEAVNKFQHILQYKVDVGDGKEVLDDLTTGFIFFFIAQAKISQGITTEESRIYIGRALSEAVRYNKNLKQPADALKEKHNI